MKIKLIMMLLVLFIVLQGCTESDEKIEIPDDKYCEKDSDCVRYFTNCCGCESIAVNKNYEGVYEEKNCTGIACVASVCIIPKVAICENNECVLIELGKCNSSEDCISVEGGCIDRESCDRMDDCHPSGEEDCGYCVEGFCADTPNG